MNRWGINDAIMSRKTFFNTGKLCPSLSNNLLDIWLSLKMKQKIYQVNNLYLNDRTTISEQANLYLIREIYII